MRRILSKLEAKASPVDWERALVDEAYEKVMGAVGLPMVERHKDQRTRSLRYGHE